MKSRHQKFLMVILLRLIEVAPYSKTTQKIEVSDYIITLVVS